MRKKALALLTAVTVMAMGTVNVFAASPTTGTTEQPVPTQTATTTVQQTASAGDYAARTTVSEGYKVEAVTETTVQEAAVAVQNEILNDVAKIGEKLNNGTLTAAATDSSKKVSATVESVVEVSPQSASKNDAGNYVVTVGVTTVFAGDTIGVLHFNGTGWETIVPTAVADGSVTFETSSLSPIAIVKLMVTTRETAPQTGETVPVAAIAFVFGLCGAAVCGKKFFA